MNIFQQRPATFDQFDGKPNAIDYYNEVVYLGNETGSVYRYPIDSSEIMIRTNSSPKPIIKHFKKGKVLQIQVLQYSENLLVNIEGAVLYLNGKTLDVIKTIHEKNICIIEVNKSKNFMNQVLMVDKKEKRAIVHEFGANPPYDHKGEINRTNFPALPSHAQFLDNLLLVAYPKREYQIINITNDHSLSLTDVKIDNNPFLQVTGDDEILFQTPQKLGIYLNKHGHVSEKSTIVFPNYPILCCKVLNPYLIVGYQKLIQVYNLNNGEKLQEILTSQNEPLRCMSVSGNRLFYGTQSDAIYLSLTEYEILIKKNLSGGKLQEALSIFNSNVDKSDPTREQKLEQLYLNAVWEFIRLLEWNQALDILVKNQLNLDCRELISLYPYLAEASKQLIPEPLKKKIQMGQMISNQLDKKYMGNNKFINQELENEKIKSESFLASVLESRKAHYNSQSYQMSMKETMKFLVDDSSINGTLKEQISLEEYVLILDYVLMKIYIKHSNQKALKEILIKGDLMCKSLYVELKEEMERKFDKKKDHAIMALFYESFGEINEALQILQEVGTNKAITDKKTIKEACENTIRILKSVKESKIIRKYFAWVLKIDIDIGSRLFQEIPENVIHPDSMLDYFVNDVFDDDEINKRKEVREKYLEAIVLVKKIEEDRFHTKLAETYVEDNLFQIYPKKMGKKDIDYKNPQVEHYRRKLNDFMQASWAKYSSKSLLDKIDDSWLFKETIFLLGKEKRHKDAIKRFIMTQEYEWAEKYCEEKNEKLLTLLFENYLYIYKKMIQSNNKEGITEFKDKIFNAMKKYATHPQLDQVEFLNQIPPEWILADKGADDGLYSFISATISHTLHEKKKLLISQKPQ